MHAEIAPPHKKSHIYCPCCSKPVWASFFCRTQRKTPWRVYEEVFFVPSLDVNGYFFLTFWIFCFVFNRRKKFKKFRTTWVGKITSKYSFLGWTTLKKLTQLKVKVTNFSTFELTQLKSSQVQQLGWKLSQLKTTEVCCLKIRFLFNFFKVKL